MFKLSPETGEKVWISTVTLTEIKNAQKAGDVPKVKKKQLVRIPSKQIRESCFEEAARAIETKERQILPTYGGRPWQVFCRLTEPNTIQKPPLFRWFRGKLELAVLPHFLEKVPAPMETRGMAKLEEESEEGFFNASTDLCERAESLISRIAWNDREHKIPLMTLKWLSPNHDRFSSRKSAEEEAKKLTEQQLFVDKIVFGYGSRGQKLLPRKPTKHEALKAGKWRFLRDGIWVVGQEESWQNDRAVEIERQAKKRKLADAQKVIKPKAAPCAPKSALQLFVKTQRNSYRKEMQEKLLRILDDAQFTLTDADRELREIWKKNMTKQEKQLWKDLLDGKETCGELMTVSTRKDEIENMQQDPIDANLGVIHRDTGAPCLTEQDLHKQASGPSYSITGFDVYKRDRLNGMVHRGVASTVRGRPQTTVDSSSAELRRIWDQLGSVVREEWEEKAAAECLKVAKAVVVSPGDSEEEVEESTGNACLQRSGNCPDASVSSAVKTVEDEKACGTHRNADESSINDVSLESKASGESQSRAYLRRSGRLPKVKRFFEAEIQRQSGEVKLAHVPSVWAIPVLQEGELDFQINEQMQPATEEVTPFELHSNEAKPVPKRKRMDCQPVQMTHSEHWRLPYEQIQMCYDAAMEHFDKVMYTVKARALFAELADGFDLLRERGRGRFDMELPAFDEPRFQFLTDFAKTPWMGVVKQILGEDVVLIHKGVFLSNPGADAQEYHQDGPHLTTQCQRPCHAINVFVPLVDLTLRNGPTEFVLGSHILDYDDYDRSKVVTPQVTAGTPIIFDYRLGHRGLPNTSDVCRPIVYCTYAAAANGKEFRDSVNFSRKRYHRLGDMVDKPLSREERRKIREASQENRHVLKLVEEIDAAAVESIRSVVRGDE